MRPFDETSSIKCEKAAQICNFSVAHRDNVNQEIEQVGYLWHSPGEKMFCDRD